MARPWLADTPSAATVFFVYVWHCRKRFHETTNAAKIA